MVPKLGWRSGEIHSLTWSAVPVTTDTAWAGFDIYSKMQSCFSFRIYHITPSSHILSKHAPVLFIPFSGNHSVQLLFFMVICNFPLPDFYFLLTAVVLFHSRKMTSSFILYIHHQQDSHGAVQKWDSCCPVRNICREQPFLQGNPSISFLCNRWCVRMWLEAEGIPRLHSTLCKRYPQDLG